MEETFATKNVERNMRRKVPDGVDGSRGYGKTFFDCSELEPREFDDEEEENEECEFSRRKTFGQCSCSESEEEEEKEECHSPPTFECYTLPPKSPHDFFFLERDMNLFSKIADEFLVKSMVLEVRLTDLFRKECLHKHKLKKLQQEINITKEKINQINAARDAKIVACRQSIRERQRKVYQKVLESSDLFSWLLGFVPIEDWLPLSLVSELWCAQITLRCHRLRVQLTDSKPTTILSARKWLSCLFGKFGKEEGNNKSWSELWELWMSDWEQEFFATTKESQHKLEWLQICLQSGFKKEWNFLLEKALQKAVQNKMPKTIDFLVLVKGVNPFSVRLPERGGCILHEYPQYFSLNFLHFAQRFQIPYSIHVHDSCNRLYVTWGKSNSLDLPVFDDSLT